MRLFLTVDFSFVTLWLGHMGASSLLPSLYCTALGRRISCNGRLVDQYRDMRAGSKTRGTLRTRSHYQKTAGSYHDGRNASRRTSLW